MSMLPEYVPQRDVMTCRHIGCQVSEVDVFAKDGRHGGGVAEARWGKRSGVSMKPAEHDHHSLSKSSNSAAHCNKQ